MDRARPQQAHGLHTVGENSIDPAQRLIDDPTFFVRGVFKAEPWYKQREILEAIATGDRVAVKSGNSVGKSTTAAWTAIWYLLSRRPSIVLTTAPTARQVDVILWGEIRRWLNAAQGLELYPPGSLKPAASELRIAPEHYALGFTAVSDTSFQGIHGENVLVIVDEAPGVSLAVWKGIHRVLMGGKAKLLMIGNPTSRSGPFWDAFQPGSGFKTITISAFDHPNIQRHDPTFIPGGVTEASIDEVREFWGEGSAMYQTSVLGEFPDSGGGTELSMTTLMRACTNEKMPADIRNAEGYLGVDVARFGEDLSTLITARGGWVTGIEWHSKRDLAFVAQKTQDILGREGIPPGNCAIDQTGLGAGVVDMLRERELWVRGIDFGSKSTIPARFANLKSELEWTLARSFAEDQWVLPKMEGRDRLINDLLDMRFHYTPKRQVKSESKDDVRKRLGRSPDFRDALTLCWACRKRGQIVTTMPEGAMEDKDKALKWGQGLATKLGLDFGSNPNDDGGWD